MLRETILSNTFRFGECLIWLGAYNTDGYPRGLIDGDNNAKLHREIFFLHNGYYPIVVRHTCDDTRCLNPNHLVSGFPLDNIQDRHERGRTFNQVSPFEVEIVKNMRSGNHTLKQIAEKFGYKYKRVEYINNRYVKEN